MPSISKLKRSHAVLQVESLESIGNSIKHSSEMKYIIDANHRVRCPSRGVMELCSFDKAFSRELKRRGMPIGIFFDGILCRYAEDYSVRELGRQQFRLMKEIAWETQRIVSCLPLSLRSWFFGNHVKLMKAATKLGEPEITSTGYKMKDGDRYGQMRTGRQFLVSDDMTILGWLITLERTELTKQEYERAIATGTVIEPSKAKLQAVWLAARAIRVVTSLVFRFSMPDNIRLLYWLDAINAYLETTRSNLPGTVLQFPERERKSRRKSNTRS